MRLRVVKRGNEYFPQRRKWFVWRRINRRGKLIPSFMKWEYGCTTKEQAFQHIHFHEIEEQTRKNKYYVVWDNGPDAGGY